MLARYYDEFLSLESFLCSGKEFTEEDKQRMQEIEQEAEVKREKLRVSTLSVAKSLTSEELKSLRDEGRR